MDEYVNQLMIEQGVPNELDSDVRAQLFADLKQRVINFLNRRMLDAMDDAAVSEFEKLVDSNPTDPMVVQQFIETRVPNREQVTKDALVEFRQLFLGAKA